MLKLNKDQKRLPIGGHQYHERGYTFRGEDFNEVEKKLREFRVRNGLPMGDPTQDILVYYANNWPYMVKEDRETPEPSPHPEEFVQWRQWITDTWAKPPKKIVTIKEAKDRWKVCETCPFNRRMEWAETQEVAELKRRAFLLRRGEASLRLLGFCSLHKADLSVFTMIDSPGSFSKKDANAAGECWCSLEGPK